MEAWDSLKHLGIALMPAVILFAISAWRNLDQLRMNVLQIVILAAGAGILAGVIALTMVHTLVSPWRTHTYLGPAYLVPLFAYAAVLIAEAWKRQSERLAMVLLSPIGLLLLICPGLFSAFVIQCSFGPCM